MYNQQMLEAFRTKSNARSTSASHPSSADKDSNVSSSPFDRRQNLEVQLQREVEEKERYIREVGQLSQTNADLGRKVEKMRGQVAGLKRMEKMLRGALLLQCRICQQNVVPESFYLHYQDCEQTLL